MTRTHIFRFAFAVVVTLTASMTGQAALSYGSPCLRVTSHESVYPQCGAGWAVSARNYPTNIAPGHAGTVEVDVLNVGAEASTGAVTVTDELPAGVTVEEAGSLRRNPTEPEEPRIDSEFWECTGDGPGPAPSVAGAKTVTCTNNPINLPAIPGGAGGPTAGNIEHHNHQPELGLKVLVGAGAPEGQRVNRVTVTGGGAAAASTTAPIEISSAAPTDALTGFHAWFSNSLGEREHQAGAHPYAATFTLDAATTLKEGELAVVNGGFRNVELIAPPGLVGNTRAVEQCTRRELDALECPPGSIVGIASIYILGIGINTRAIFNMVPPAGTPAELAYTIEGINSFIDFALRTGGNYALVANVSNIPARSVYKVVTTLWGAPADHTHDRWRNNTPEGCSEEQIETSVGCDVDIGEKRTPKPFLTMPTSCGEPLEFAARANTWENGAFSEPLVARLETGDQQPYTLTGCEDMTFAPALATTPSSSEADTPTGFAVDVTAPLEGFDEPLGLSTSALRNPKVTLPPGLVVNPGQAAGLQACSAAQSAVGTEEAPSCPVASRLGEVKIASPLLEGAVEHELTGSVYLLQSNPPDLKLLVAASADGINLKLVGNVHLDTTTGQVQFVSFDGNTPPYPFSHLHLAFNEGPQAALATPAKCGTYNTEADFLPWAGPAVLDALTEASFNIAGGARGTGCPGGVLPFSPSLTAGGSSVQAGGYTDFTTLLARGDGQQRTDRFAVTLPAGTAGMISHVPVCDEADANANTCPASSKVGHAIVTAGPGTSPLTIPQLGEPEVPIYLTGPYEGAPFGLSIPAQVIAGPFNLGTVTTRARLNIDPATAQVTVTTDPLPQIIDGVPTDLRSIYADIDRPEFVFNPTSCTTQSTAGTATGIAPVGEPTEPPAGASLTSPFNLTGCRELTYTPKVTISTAGRATRARGAGLRFKIAYPKGAMGHQAWFKEAKFTIPKQLPAEERTLHLACLAKTFETNPADCPPHSKVGQAVVHTPVLPVPLTGPVYLVSYGGAKFPDAVMDLTGDNVHIQLTGETFINNQSYTSVTFPATPDVPFENVEVTIPPGEYPEFGSYASKKHPYDFCGQHLTVPTFLKAQNGLETHKNTPLTITGCPKPKKAKKARNTRRHSRHSANAKK